MTNHNSRIEWTDTTWNPVTGCTKVSPGCDNCYALTMHERFNGKGSFSTITLHEERLPQPLRWRKPRRVFVNSMSDLFHADVRDDFIVDVFAVMALTPQHTYQVLTKRHSRMRSLMNRDDFWYEVGRKARHLGYAYDGAANYLRGGENVYDVEGWESRRHLDNVWLGVSVEDQRWADIRVPALLATPAVARFLSCEPLLGPVDLTRIAYTGGGGTHLDVVHGHHGVPDMWIGPGKRVDWVIAGGESGPRARPMIPDWARQLRDQCQTAGVPFFFKQWGAWAPIGGEPTRAGDRWFDDGTFTGPIVRRVGKKAAGRELDGRTWDEFPAVTP